MESAVRGGFGFLFGFLMASASTMPLIIGALTANRALSRPETAPAKAIEDLIDVNAPAAAPHCLK